MSPTGSIALYSGVIVAGALGGAVVPLVSARKDPLTQFLAFAAGVMLGAAFFHMLPEAFHGGGYSVFSIVPIGFGLLFLLERTVLVHICEEPPDCAEHAHSTFGLTAFLGLSIHTLFDGVALGSAAVEGVGFTAFTAVLAHKIPSSLSLAAILKSEGRSRVAVLGYVALFGLMVPLGALLYFLVQRHVSLDNLAPKALAFSAGTFLYIAVSDLLPHVNRHGPRGRVGNLAALGLGLLSMYLLSQWMGHPHEE